MLYQVKISYPKKIMVVRAKSSEEAEEKAQLQFFKDIGEENDSIENNFDFKVVCRSCGVSLMLDEEQVEGECCQCSNN